MANRTADVIAEGWRLVRFGGVGIVSLLVYSSLYAALAETTRLPPVPISFVSYATAMIVSFVGHKYVTFAVHRNTRAQILKFVILHSIFLLITVAVTDLIVDILRWPYGVGIATVDVIIPMLSFVAMKFIVFDDKSRAQTTSVDAVDG